MTKLTITLCDICNQRRVMAPFYKVRIEGIDFILVTTGKKQVCNFCLETQTLNGMKVLGKASIGETFGAVEKVAYEE